MLPVGPEAPAVEVPAVEARPGATGTVSVKGWVFAVADGAVNVEAAVNDAYEFSYGVSGSKSVSGAAASSMALSRLLGSSGIALG